MGAGDGIFLPPRTLTSEQVGQYLGADHFGESNGALIVSKCNG